MPNFSSISYDLNVFRWQLTSYIVKIYRSILFMLLLFHKPWPVASYISHISLFYVAMPLFAMRLFLFAIMCSPSAAIYNMHPN